MFLIIGSLFLIMLILILVVVWKNERLLSQRTLPQAGIEEYWVGEERRRHVRFKKILDVDYVVEKKSHLKNGRTIDISEGGMKLRLEEKLSQGMILNLAIKIPDSKKNIEVEGEVVWSTDVQERDANGKRLFHSGIRFLALKEPSGTRLANYMASLELECKS